MLAGIHDDTPVLDRKNLVAYDDSCRVRITAPARYSNERIYMNDDDQYEGYCVKCTVKQVFTGVVETTSRGGLVAKGRCPVCGTKMSRFVPKPKP